ncbi:MAG: hypothetical protein P8M66_00580 [Flavobacteriaceae bacterium]|jgi:hypothetical protein|nr:hypothetical protein [Formosa sp.]MDG2497991.1 hypothetical protein [Flavobacteriaceae bacterium]
MKQSYVLLALLMIIFGCNSDSDDVDTKVNATLTFSHYWDQTSITNSEFNTLNFTNYHGELMSIERLRYLISDITFTKTDGQTILLEGYNLVDVTNQTNLSFTPSQKIAKGTYSNVSFIFGLVNEKNTDGAYNDLNSASWNVPGSLGGGYHYMQLDGKFINSSNESQGYNYHTIRAVDNIDSNPSFPQNTFIRVDLGGITVASDTEIKVLMHIDQWFKNPYSWDLNVYNQMLMPNSSAQILMYENGQSVFSLGGIN